MSKVYVRTKANNAEKTIRRAIESVLSQTYGDFLYYIDDNGSTDGTRKIIEEYIAKDKRIVPFYNKINNVFEDEYIKKNFCELTENIADDDFLCYLDADDEYCPTFLENMLFFMHENNLDIACCGSRMLSVEHNNSLMGVRCLKNNLILQNDNDFEKFFPVYHQYARTVWGKVYKGFTLRGRTFYDNPEDFTYPSYGSDTVDTLKAFSKANRVGILAKTLHNYYISKKSVSYKLDSKRIISDQLLYKYAYKFLISKCGYVSKQNEKFLSDVYFCSLKDTFNVIVGSQMEPIEKMRNILDMFTNETTVGQLENGYGSGDIFKSLRSTILKWLLSQKICRRSEGAKLAAEIILPMYREWQQLIQLGSLCFYIRKMPEVITFLVEKDYVKALERIQIYYKRHDKDEPALAELEIALYKILNKTNSELFSLLSDIKINRHKCSETLNVDAEISTIIGKYPLLNSLNIDLAVLFSRPVQHIMEGDYGKALDSFLSVTGVEINDDDAEKYIMFGQNLSAAAQNSNTYIYFKKVWISYLIDHSKNEAAAKELDEFLKILPHDNDFLKLKQRLGET